MHTECANTSESRKSVVKAKNNWMKLKCLGCTVGNTAVLQCCSNVTWDTNFPHVTKMINKMNENPNQYAVKKKEFRSKQFSKNYTIPVLRET
jgi:hypothetical protein